MTGTQSTVPAGTTKDLQGRRGETVLITGASSGIGRELARLFASDGTTEPPPSRPTASSILGSHRLPAHSRHRSTNAQYAGSNGHTLATMVPSGDRSATAQSPTPHGTQPSAASSARTWR